VGQAFLPAAGFQVGVPGTIGNYQVSVRVPDASLLTPNALGYFNGSISLEPGDPVLGTFMIEFVPIKL